MRPAAIPFLAAAWLVAGAAHAQEAAPAPDPTSGSGSLVAEAAGGPLLLRIRPRDEAPEDGPGADAAEAARAAEGARLAALARAAAAREAFEARITARANRAIASVCTGCLGPVPRSLALAPPEGGPAAARLVPASIAMTEP
ncbi:hypothetical protein [Methylobacterium platani]|uniref:Uncharacterized protein n=2 Tax=Methylobacterium platani TaxID=427683 RepID=A0A179SCP5_9HYPH|nr:hypothetical protein [Methylobacterium platani]KMO17674.1 hypothetical protein SQ03_12115 [Methylobacterium platani JCM 14648]OAS25229.1 hypothetical protein A5481_09935 [Methylobacterium platani]